MPSETAAEPSPPAPLSLLSFSPRSHYDVSARVCEHRVQCPDAGQRQQRWLAIVQHGSTGQVGFLEANPSWLAIWVEDGQPDLPVPAIRSICPHRVPHQGMTSVGQGHVGREPGLDVLQCVAYAKLGMALRHLPSGFAVANQVWMWAAFLALTLSVTLQALTGNDHPHRAHGKRLRRELIVVPARVVRHARRLLVRLAPAQQDGPFLAAYQLLRALPTPAG